MVSALDSRWNGMGLNAVRVNFIKFWVKHKPSTAHLFIRVIKKNAYGRVAYMLDITL